VKAYILAGGSGSRLSPTKGFMTVGDTPIVERVCAAAEPLVSETVLVGPPEQLRPPTRWRVVSEEQAGVAGPLGGLCAALADAGTEDALVLPWDAPFITTDALRCLRDVKGAADAAVPRRGDHVEPLFALYGPTCLGPAREALARGERRVVAFYGAVTIRWVAPEDLDRFGEWDVLFFNVNTPSDLARARQMAGAARGDER
jgi:molybdopterin-guanine dinucleotide biosynthesis protein A